MASLTILRQGYRKPVKVTHQTLLANVLFEACRLFQLDPFEHTLRKEDAKQTLDMSLNIKQASLSLTATLELVPYKIASNATITAAFQLPSGGRQVVTAKPTTTFWEALQSAEQLSRSNLTRHEINGNYASPSIQSSSREIDGLEVLTKETFYHLGLVGGNILFRFKFKETQQSLEATIGLFPSAFPASSIITPEPSEMETSRDEAQENAQEVANEPQQAPELQAHSESEKGDDGEKMDSGDKSPEANADSEVVPGVGQRDMKIFHPSDREFDPSRFELPDDFYEMTPEDIQALTAKTKEKQKMADVLMTKEMRQKLSAVPVKHFAKVMIRVRFPNGFVLQGSFRPQETMGDVSTFVKEAIAEPVPAFYLYITPPVKKLVDMSATLQSLSFVPATLLYFGLNDKDARFELNPELVQKSADISVTIPAPVVVEKKDGGAVASGSLSKSTMDVDNEGEDGNKQGAGKASAKLPKWLKRPTS